MIRALLILCLLCEISAECSAQSDFTPGYLITQDQDTVKGLINFSVAELNPASCVFRANIGSAIETYNPEMIEGYGSLAENRFLQSFAISLPGGKSKQVFAEMLVRGKANLLVYEDFFYIQKDSTRTKVEKTQQKESNVNGSRYVHVHKTYIGILNRFFSDCLPDKLLKGEVDYNKHDFADLFKKYSECQKTDYFVYSQSKESVKVAFNLVGGINRSKLSYSKAGLNIFRPDTYFFFGAGIELSLPDVSKKVSLTIEATYNHATYLGERDGFNSSGTVRNDYTVDVKVIKLPVGMKVNFSAKKFIPYSKVGMTPLFPLRYSWNIEEGSIIEANYRIKEKHASVVLWAALGFQKEVNLNNSIFVELRFEKYYEFIQFYGPGSPTNSPSTVFNKMLVFGFKF